MTKSAPVKFKAFTLTAKAADFRKALATVLKCRDASPFSGIPILRAVTIAGTNLAGERKGFTVAHLGIDVQVRAEAEGECAGSIALPIRMLESFMAGAEGEDLTITRAPDDSVAHLSCGDYSARIIPLSADDAPGLLVPKMDGKDYSEIHTAEGVLSWLLTLTLPFISTEETRYYLNGVALECDGVTLRAVATDGHRLGTRSAKLPAPAPVFSESIIVPRVTVLGVKLLAPEREVTFTLDEKGGCIVFSFPDIGTEIRSKLIDGTFPDWRRVVPSVSNYTFNLDTARISRFARIAGGMRESRGDKAIKINSLGSDGLRMTAVSPDIGEAESRIPGEFPPFGSFGVNSRYLASIAKAVGSKTLKINLEDDCGGSPITVRNPDPVDNGFVIIMPMRV